MRAEEHEYFKKLTRREREVLAGILEFKTLKEISAELNISTKTVQVHSCHIYEKFGVSRYEGRRAIWKLYGLRK